MLTKTIFLRQSLVIKVTGILLFFSVALFGFPKSSRAIPIPSTKVQDLVSQSDAICKGRVLEVKKIGEFQKKKANFSTNIDVMLASFQPERILKGEVSSKIIEIEFWITTGPEFGYFIEDIYQKLKEGEYTLVFLKRENGRYVFTQPLRSKIPIASGKLSKVEEGADPLVLLEEELVNSLEDKNPEIVLSSLKILGELKSKSSAKDIERLLESKDDILRGEALVTLLKAGDYSHMDEAIEYLDKVPSANQKLENIKINICDEFGEIRDPSLASKLNPLLSSKNELLRREVVQSLRKMQNKSSIPYLIKALDDNNEIVKTRAVMALTEMNLTDMRSKCWKEPAANEKERIGKYIILWKDWWEKEGRWKYGD